MTYKYDYPHPAVTTDIVIFTIRDDRLKILLIQRGEAPFKDSWALPGGFLKMEESLDECARRELAEETGLSDLYLEQLYSFGAPDRDPRERVITIAYYALVPSDQLTLQAGTDAADAAWFDLDELPDLAFDHPDIIQSARERLGAKMDYSTIGFLFMPRTFTLSRLQKVYELATGREMDKRNFRKWVTSLDLVEETGEKLAEGPHRPAMLYRLKKPLEVETIR